MTTNVDVDRVMGDLKIIDGDSHFAEPGDLWTSRAPAKYKDRVPQMKRVNDTVAWFLGDQQWTGLGGHTIAKGKSKTLGVLCLPYDDIETRQRAKALGARWDPVHRRWLMSFKMAKALGLRMRRLR